MDSHEDVAEQSPFITESWSDDGLKLTVTGRYPNGVEADVSTTWATRETAETNAASARAAAEKMLRTRRFDLEAEEGRRRSNRARRAGPLLIGTGSGYRFKWVPEFSLKSGIGIRWANGYIAVTTSARRERTSQ